MLTRPLESFAGNSVSPIYGAASIERRGDRLEIKIGPAAYEGHLSHWDGDTFLLQFADPDTAPGLLQFQFGAGPSATGIVGHGIPGALATDYGPFVRPAAGVSP